MRRDLAIFLVLAVALAVSWGCSQGGDRGNGNGADRDVPPETRGAELLDSTRLDAAESGSGAYDSVFDDSGEVNER